MTDTQAKGGYSAPSAVDALKNYFAKKGHPVGANDSILDFDFTLPPPVAGMPALPVSMSDVKIDPLTPNKQIPAKLLDGMERNAAAFIKTLGDAGVDIRQAAEFKGFDIETGGKVDTKKVGAILLAAASVSRVGGRGASNPAIIGMDFDGKLTFGELAVLSNPLKTDDFEKIKGAAGRIYNDHVLALAINAAAPARGAGAAQTAVDCGQGSVIITNPATGVAISSMDCNRR